VVHQDKDFHCASRIFKRGEDRLKTGRLHFKTLLLHKVSWNAQEKWAINSRRMQAFAR